MSSPQRQSTSEKIVPHPLHRATIQIRSERGSNNLRGLSVQIRSRICPKRIFTPKLPKSYTVAIFSKNESDWPDPDAKRERLF